MKPSEAARERRLRRLCRALDLDEFAGELVLELLERVEEAERELERWRAFAGDRGGRRV